MAIRAGTALRLRLPRSLDVASSARLSTLAGSLPLCGAPVRISFAPQLHAHRGRLRSGEGKGTAVHAATFLRSRKMVLESELLENPEELARILTHELFHFAWPRLGNPRRHRWEQLLLAERRERARGELGWSAEWRKRALADPPATRLWRDYLAESFCDSAAWLYAGVAAHDDFTLADRFRRRRRRWFVSEFPSSLTI
ncbi:MAG: hypothetical protein NTY38_19760 [Acidobacteria bacterium]|nr:hypothetical protein [Acidobacteriota bacterium]